jgi:hypothetical protein
MSITTNADQVNRELDSFVGAVLERVVPRSINELMRQAKTAGTREAARLYGMRVGDIAVSWHEDAAVRGELEASINAKGAGFPLSLFDPVPGPKGVSVRIKGRRVTIPHAFMVKRFNKRVFARGAYGSLRGGKATGETFGRFVFSKTRHPINQLYTFGPPETLANETVSSIMQARIEERMASVIEREMRAIGRGF